MDERWLAGLEGFDWDESNIEKNWIKHRVSGAETEEVFDNSPLRIERDPRWSLPEERFIALGRSKAGRLLFVCFTVRRARIRVISARDMNRKELISYARGPRRED